MARFQTPPPGRVVVSIIYSSIDALADALRQLERQFGRVVCETLEIPYSGNKYAEEMGHNLQRRFYSFNRQFDRDKLPSIKTSCDRIERQFGDRVDDYTFRTVNIDPGMLTPDNLIMASHREYNHRLYLGEGTFGELTLVWAKGRFVRLPWTGPDFCQQEAIDFFERVRDMFEPQDCLQETELEQ